MQHCCQLSQWQSRVEDNLPGIRANNQIGPKGDNQGNEPDIPS